MTKMMCLDAIVNFEFQGHFQSHKGYQGQNAVFKNLFL